MAEELITDLIDEPRITKQLNETIAGLGIVKDKILEINNLGKGIRLGDEGVENFRKARTAAEQLAAAEVKLSQANADLGKELAKVRLQTEMTNKANKEAARESLGLVDAYKRLSNQFVEAARNAKNLAATDLAKGLKSFSKETEDALRHANDLNNQLKAIDAGVGQYQRNVGNYTSATFALSQILREAPAFAFNLQTGLLAISNNMPILIDEFNKLSKTIDQNTKQNIGASRAIGILAKSLFSWTNLLTIGISVLTIFGPKLFEVVKGLFEFGDAATEAEKRQKALNDAIQKGLQGTTLEITQAKRLLDIASDLNASMLDRKEAVRLLKEQYPEYLKGISQEKILAGDTVGVYNQLVVSLRNVARTKAIVNQISANEAEDLKLETELEKERARLSELQAAREQRRVESRKQLGRELQIYNEATNQEITSQNKIAELEEKRALLASENAVLERRATQDTTDLKISAAKKAAEEQKKLSKKAAKDEAELTKARLEQQKIALETAAEQQKHIFENERKGYEERANALTAFTLLSNGIARVNQRISEADAKGNQEKIKVSREQFNQDYQNNEIAHFNSLLEITKDYVDEESAILLNGAKKRENDISKQEAEERTRTLSLFQTGKIDAETYEAERLRIENKYAILRLQSEADTIKKILELRRVSGEDVKKVEEQLLDITQKIRDLDVEYHEKAELAKRRAAEKTAKEQAKLTKEQAKQSQRDYNELSRQVQQIFKQIGDLGGPILDILSNRFERQKQAIQEQIDLISEREKTEIDAINRSTAGEQEKADRIAVIQAQSNAQRRTLEAEQRRVAQEQARFDKAKAIFDIVANTAVNVVKFLGVPVLAALAAAVGAAQLAAVASRPIPKYKGGRKGGPAEFAYVGDGGVSEVVEYGGRTWVTPRRPTLTYLPAGATVHKSVGSYLGEQGTSVLPDLSGRSSDAGYNKMLIGEVRRGNRRVVEAIRNSKAAPVASMTRGEIEGMVVSVMQNYSRIEKYKR